MPKAILAIRSYPATLLLAIFLFLATLVITTGSLGKVGSGGGGDSGDGGSGIGGTGKSGEFGGSGFGGTGGPSPFFTSLEDDDSAPEPALLHPLESGDQDTPTELASVKPDDSTTVAIENSLNEAIEEAVLQHPMVNESQIILATDSPDVDDVSPIGHEQQSSSLQVVEAVQLQSVQPEVSRPGEIQLIDSIPLPSNEVPYSAVAENLADVAPVPTPEAPQQVAETLPVVLDTAPVTTEDAVDRRSLPDRIQRPDLPPFQRIRPVERASIMPPRVQPMRI